MAMVRQRYQSISSRYIDDQRILGSDWSRGAPGLIQLRVIVSHAPFSWWIYLSKNQRNQLTPFWNIADQQILKSNWTRGKPGHTQ